MTSIRADLMCNTCGKHEVKKYGCRQRGENLTNCIKKLPWWDRIRFREYAPVGLKYLIRRVR